MSEQTIKAWAGFTDGEMYLRFDPDDDAKEYCIYKTRARARKDFHDVRRVTVVVDQPSAKRPNPKKKIKRTN